MKSSFEECGNVDLGNAPLLFARHQWLQIQKPAQRLSRVRPPPHGVELPVVCAVTIDLRLEPWPRLRSMRSEEHTSELQSRLHLVCRLLLEKKKTLLIVRTKRLS